MTLPGSPQPSPEGRRDSKPKTSSFVGTSEGAPDPKNWKSLKAAFLPANKKPKTLAEIVIGAAEHEAVMDDERERFVKAIKDGDTEWLQLRLNDCETDEQANALANTTSQGLSVLMLSIRFNYPNIVQLLLQHGADPAYEGELHVAKKAERSMLKRALSRSSVSRTAGENSTKRGLSSKCGDRNSKGESSLAERSMSRRSGYEKVVQISSPLTLALESNRPYVIRMVCEAYLLKEFVGKGKFLSARELAGLFRNEEHQATVRDILIDIYASVDPDILTGGIQGDFRLTPALTLHDLIDLAARSDRKARSMRSYDPFTATDLSSSSARLQLAAAGCLHAIGSQKDGLGRYECDELLRSPLGHQALSEALRLNCQIFVAQPEVQAYVRREWYGTLLTTILDGHEMWHVRFGCGLLYILATVSNCALLPLAAALPVLEAHLYERLSSRAFHDHMHEVEENARRFEMAMMKSDNKKSTFRRGKGILGCTGSRQQQVQRSHTKALSKIDDDTDAELIIPLTDHIKLIDLYLLRTPHFKFALRLGFNVGLIITQQLTNPAELKRRDDEHGWSWTVMLLWALSGCLAEYRSFASSWEQLQYELRSFVASDSPSQYRSDVFNLTDALGFHLLLISLLLPLEYNVVAVGLWSVATVLAWLRLIRVLELDQSLGPVVIMCVKMLGDVVKLMVLVAFVLCALVSGTYVLFKFAASDEDEILYTEDQISTDPIKATNRKGTACTAFYHLEGDWQDWARILFVMWNGAFTEEHFTSCAMQSYPNMMWMLWTYNFMFSLTTAVLLLNMLIAMMGKTIDNVWEASSTHAQFLFARLTIASMTRPPEPPPLNLLRVPSYLLYCTVFSLAHFLPEHAQYGCLRKATWLLKTAFEYSTLLAAKSPCAINVHRMTGEYRGTSLRQRSTFEAWRAAWSNERLTSFIGDFIDARDDVVSQEGMTQSRHRAKLKKETQLLIKTQLDAHRTSIEATIESHNMSVMHELRRMRDAAGGGVEPENRRGSVRSKRRSQELMLPAGPGPSLGRHSGLMLSGSQCSNEQGRRESLDRRGGGGVGAGAPVPSWVPRPDALGGERASQLADGDDADPMRA